ncbi:MAG TPA: endonuclease/exonuclease/phosphatase family protein, partial [Candidatus Deferrimicrobium sp.]|nr:endonuclease/exonuclease/phosphatase family protein [Candidatus Deferrimicrobium sp.]
MKTNTTFKKIYSELALITIIFLFFLQLISDFVKAIYAQCLLTLSLNENVLAVLFLFSPIILIFFGKKSVSDKFLVITGVIMIICRIIEPILATQLSMIVSGLGVGCFLLFFPAFIQKMNTNEQEQKSLTVGVGLAIALAASILLRTLGSSVDLSTASWFQGIGWVLGILAAIMVLNLLNRSQKEPLDTPTPLNLIDTQSKPNRLSKIIAISLGLFGIILLIYSAFASPTVLSRWTEGNYLMIMTILIVTIEIFAVSAMLKPNLFQKLNPKTLLLWNGIFVLTLVLTIALNQINFPAVLGDYPIVASPTTWIQYIPLILMLVLSPVVLLDFILLIREIIRRHPNTRTIGGAFSIASIFLLIMILGEIFTTTYAYIPAIGPFFRDMFWFVFLIIGLAIILPVLFVKTGSFLFKNPLNGTKTRTYVALIIGIISFGTILGGFFAAPSPIAPSGNVTSIKVMTYNIQQGYDANGIWNFDGQLAVIRSENPDILGIQESDIARISGGNADPVRYFADKLKMFSYYGPKTVTGTFGIALLSKYPIENATTFYMYSIGEQIACVQAQITINTTTFNVFIAHPENPNITSQQQAMLSRIIGKNNIIFMGDFNFAPLTEPYNI